MFDLRVIQVYDLGAYSYVNFHAISWLTLVRAPELEPKSGCEESFSLLRKLSQQCLEDIRKGKKWYCKAATVFALRCETMTFTQFHLYH